MTRRTLFSMLAATIAAFAIMFTFGASGAKAQQNQNCCTYTVDVANFAGTCFPFNVNTVWGNGFPPAAPIGGNGVTVHNLPWGCPPSSVFFGASINAMFGPFASFNNPVQYNFNGCCGWVRIAFDQNGCVYITIRPC
jgi:hypothetical protein